MITYIHRLRPKEFNPENIRFLSPEEVKFEKRIPTQIELKNRKIIKIDYNNGMDEYDLRSLSIQLPKLKAFFGLGKRDENFFLRSVKNTFELELAKDDEEFFKKIEDLDSQVIDICTLHSEYLFGRTLEKNDIKLLFKPSIEFGIDENGIKSPRMKLRILHCEFFDSSRERIDTNVSNHSEIIPEEFECRTLIRCSHVKIIKDKIEIVWELTQALICQNTSIPSQSNKNKNIER